VSVADAGRRAARLEPYEAGARGRGGCAAERPAEVPWRVCPVGRDRV